MKFLTLKETQAWLAVHGLAHPGSLGAAPTASLSYCIPGDSGKKTVLSRTLLELLASGSELLLWITEYGVWRSCEDLVLFDGFRRSIGETRSLNEAPGLVFAKNDLPQAASLLGMALYFVWGAVVMSPGMSLLVEISHDEVMDVTFLGGKEMPECIAAQVGRILGPPLGPLTQTR